MKRLRKHSPGFRTCRTLALVLCLYAAASLQPAYGQVPDPLQARTTASARAFMEEGRREVVRGSYARAIRLLSAAIHKGPEPDAYKLRGRAYLLSGDLEKAAEDLGRYITVQPSDPEGYLLRGDLASATGNWNRAVVDYRKAVQLEPSSVEANVCRGLAYMAMERYSPAAKDFETALSIDPSNLDALSNLGVANLLAGRPNAARKCLEEALQRETDGYWKQKLAAWIACLPTGPDAPIDDKALDMASQDDETWQPENAGAKEPKPERHLDKTADTAANSAYPKQRQPSATRPGSPKTRWAQLSGTWETTYMGSRISMEVNHTGTSLSGVLRVHGPLGKQDIYHINGTVGYDGSIKAAHHSGHHFDGRIVEPGRVVGVLTTKNGQTFPVDFAPR